MEAPRVAPLHQLDDRPLRLAIDEDYDGSVRVVVDVTSPATRNSTERTALLMAGESMRRAHEYVDLKTLVMQMTGAERRAVLQDASTPTMVFVKQETKEMAAMAVPLMLVVLLEQLPNVAIMAMLGQIDPAHSTEILAACGVAGIFQTVLFSGIARGLAGALDTVCAQSYGAKRYVEFWLYVQAGVLMLAACFPVMIAILLNGAQIAHWLGQDPAIAKKAAPLQAILLLTLPMFMIVLVQKSALQAQGVTKPLAAASLVSWVVALPAAYVLGFHTSLGYIGINLSSVLNYVVQALILHQIVKENEVYRTSWPGWRFDEAALLLRKLAPLGGSNLLMTSFQMLGLIMVSLLLGILPDPALPTAVNGIFSSVAVLSWAPMLGLCIAGTIRMGNALGAGQARRASVITQVLLGLSFSVATIGTIAIVSLAAPISRFFTADQEIVKATIKLFHSCAIVIPIVGSVFTLQGIFRACGEQWYGAKLLGACLLVLGAPLSVFLASHLELGIAGLWYGNCLGTVAMIVSTGLWLYRLNWDEMARNARLNTHLQPHAADTA
ncbi:hypothetical protein Poli38472_012096 [Pythium oligandrum]|uniref:Protein DETOXIFICATION n=1 Tax=Pythium oligandrum TaxID=41045 RepID=A0A8K1CQQ2_PYTOL|nr:hypothetical protein Poli38472_012096 [Pythium oligandrum]|eukprot:TMW66980.1 hypothetical protein Poli38472_012096 [Pythium oligandrum]